LSAPVLLDIDDDSPNTITHVPQTPMSPDTPETKVPRDPTDLVELYASKEDTSIVADVGSISGCWRGAGCIAFELKYGGFGVPRRRPTAKQISPRPRCTERKNSKGVSTVLDSSEDSESRRKMRGNTWKGGKLRDKMVLHK